MELIINFGALSDSLEKQLSQQGFKDTKLDLHEKIKRSILMLGIHGYIPKGIKEKAFKKLLKDIQKCIIPLGGDINENL